MNKISSAFAIATLAMMHPTSACGRETASLDHIVYRADDPRAEVAEIRTDLGVDLTFGGKHTNGKTMNWLGSLGDGVYLEVLGPVDDQTAGTQGIPHRATGHAELETFAIRVSNMLAAVDRLGAAGLRVEGPRTGGRVTPNGTMLNWRTAQVKDEDLCNYIPFLIQWSDASVHPSASSKKGLRLRQLRIVHPKAERLNRIYRLLGISLRAQKGRAATMSAIIVGPVGKVMLKRSTGRCYN